MELIIKNFLSISACLELIKKNKTEFTLSVFSVRSLNESPDFGASRKSNIVEKHPDSWQGGFYCIFPSYCKLMGKAMLLKYIIRWQSDGRKVPVLWKKNEISQVLPDTMGFVGFSRAIRNWRGKPCISLMMKYTTGWQSNGKKRWCFGKSMGTNFPGFPHSRRFAAFSLIWTKRWENMHFPYDEVYHRKEI